MTSVTLNKSLQNKDRIVRVPFRVVATSVFSKTAATILVTELELKPANMGSRVVALAPCFEYFRIVRLDVDQFTDYGGVTHYDSDILNVTLGHLEGSHAVSFEPSDASRTGVPTGLNEMAQSAQFLAGGIRDRIGFRVRKKDLLGTPLKWWNTASTGASTDALVQGIVWTYTKNNNTNDSTNPASANCIVSGIVEFKGMIAPTLASHMSDEKSVAKPVLEAPKRKPVLAELKRQYLKAKEQSDLLDLTLRARLADDCGWQDDGSSIVAVD